MSAMVLDVLALAAMPVSFSWVEGREVEIRTRWLSLSMIGGIVIVMNHVRVQIIGFCQRRKEWRSLAKDPKISGDWFRSVKHIFGRTVLGEILSGRAV